MNAQPRLPKKPARPMSAEEALAWAKRLIRDAQDSSREHIRAVERFSGPPKPKLP